MRGNATFFLPSFHSHEVGSFQAASAQAGGKAVEKLHRHGVFKMWRPVECFLLILPTLTFLVDNLWLFASWMLNLTQAAALSCNSRAAAPTAESLATFGVRQRLQIKVVSSE